LVTLKKPPYFQRKWHCHSSVKRAQAVGLGFVSLPFFIGIAGLAGYQLSRGSWRLLKSRSLAEYFIRFHFIAKSFWLNSFFVPTFFRFFKTSPHLRVFFATFMAAGVGNALWHYVRDIHLAIQRRFVDSISTFTSYLFF
jgi:hypothetical protein